MFPKRLFQRTFHNCARHHPSSSLTPADFDLKVAAHYGIPSTASILASDPIQSLLAVGTSDGRIKVFGSHNIEGLLTSPKQMPHKYLEFVQNTGILVSISYDNEIQAWNLERRIMTCSLQWGVNITAFSVVRGSHFMYVGDEYGSLTVLKYNSEAENLVQLPYHVPEYFISNAVGISSPNHQPIVGVLPQPCSSGNRVLIAYQIGLIVLWDVSKDQILFVGGGKDIQLKDGVANSFSEGATGLPDETSEHLLGEKEITALCWASSDGSILAVGYMEGDILFWNTSAEGKQPQVPSSDIVKLRLSSSKRRLPVIALHWTTNNESHYNRGKLFIYGGNEIESEFLAVLSLEWSSKTQGLRCVGRVDLTLAGSFADMILLPTDGARGHHRADLVVLTNPGQLHLYDDASLSVLLTQEERKFFASSVDFPTVIPTVNPFMTVAKLKSLPTDGNASEALTEIACIVKHRSSAPSQSSSRWSLTGGVSSNLSIRKDDGVQRVYLAGYQDGSVRIWDATYPVLSIMFNLESKVHGAEVAGSNDAISNLDICFHTLILAVGNECGLIRIYKLNDCSDDRRIHFVTETKHEVHTLAQGKGPQCRAVFSVLNSPVQVLQFTDSGAKLAVGYKCGPVAVFDMKSLSLLFIKDSASGFSSTIVSITSTNVTSIRNFAESRAESGTKSLSSSPEGVFFMLTKDATIYVVNSENGNVVSCQPFQLKKESEAISMYIMGKYSLLQRSNTYYFTYECSDNKMVLRFSLSLIEPEGHSLVSGLSHEGKQEQTFEETFSKSELTPDGSSEVNNSHEIERHSSVATAKGKPLDSLLLLCCKDSLCLFSKKSLIQGTKKSIRKVKHRKPCCWSSIFHKEVEACGLILLLLDGSIEIRSLPDLELVEESSIASILRWSFKAEMEKTMSYDNGLLTVASGSELAFVSILASGYFFRLPESLPCLHDRVLSAAADAAFGFSSNQMKKQVTRTGILGGIVKGFETRKVDHTHNPTEYSSSFSHLEGIFSKSRFSDCKFSLCNQDAADPSPPAVDDQEVGEIDIDDIEIEDAPLDVVSGASQKYRTVPGKSEKEKLLEGAAHDIKPRRRTPEEIMATYRKAGDASSVAAHARNKLIERQEKLERISRRTEELQSGAEDFAALANELVKTMEKRKWWHI